MAEETKHFCIRCNEEIEEKEVPGGQGRVYRRECKNCGQVSYRLLGITFSGNTEFVI